MTHDDWATVRVMADNRRVGVSSYTTVIRDHARDSPLACVMCAQQNVLESSRGTDLVVALSCSDLSNVQDSTFVATFVIRVMTM